MALRRNAVISRLGQALPDALQRLDRDERYVLLPFRRRFAETMPPGDLSITPSVRASVMTGAAFCGYPNSECHR